MQPMLLALVVCVVWLFGVLCGMVAVREIGRR